MFAGGWNAGCAKDTLNGGRADVEVLTLCQKLSEVRIVTAAIVVRLIQRYNLLLQRCG